MSGDRGEVGSVGLGAEGQGQGVSEEKSMTGAESLVRSQVTGRRTLVRVLWSHVR